MYCTVVSESKGEAYQVLQNNLTAVAASLNIASSKVVAGSRGTPKQLAKAPTNVATKYLPRVTIQHKILAGENFDEFC